MRLLVISALGFSIAACSGAEGKSADSDEAFTPGVYSIVVEDGPGRDERLVLTLKEDKTFEASEVQASGTYKVKVSEDEREVCFTDADRPDRDEMCLIAGNRKEDGSWEVTRDGDDQAAILTRVED